MKLLKLKAPKTEMAINMDNVAQIIKQGDETKFVLISGSWVVAPFAYDDVMHSVAFMADDVTSL